MNTSKLADISEIVSSIAIVVTLIILISEVRGNTEAIELSATSLASDDFTQAMQVLATDDSLCSAQSSHSRH
jgi:hypothetical protein